MTPERWRQVTAIFHEARGRKVPAREAYLRAACQTDPSLREDVDALLNGDAEAGSFGDSPVFTVPQPVEDLAAGSEIGTYRIEARIGSGGMGVVYRARDEKLKRTVAVKVLPEGALAGDDRRQRIVREARAASALNHPNIIAIYDIGRASGRDYIAMEYVRGVPLDQGVPERGLPIERVLGLGIQIVRALGAAHAIGLVHRDLKPANILVADDGHVKVIDFGLATQPSSVDADDRTATAMPGMPYGGIVGGTPGYAAPEQIEGRDLDARADVFAIGAVIYEMLAGRRAFHGSSTAATLASVIHDTPPLITSVRRDVPRDLHRIVVRCLEKDPQARYQDATAVLEDLARAQTRFTARTMGLAHLLRRPAVVVAAVIVGLAVLGTSAGIWRKQSQQRWARTVEIPEAQRLSGEGENFAAYRLLRQAERVLPDDPVLRELLAETSVQARIQSAPQGAIVHIRDVREANNWQLLGRTPLNGISIPADHQYVWRISLDGYQTVELMRGMPGGNDTRTVTFELQPVSAAPSDMVFVAAEKQFTISRHVPPVALESFWIDRYEVTNRQFKAFIDGGGYQRRDHWQQPILKAGVELPWAEAMTVFRDPTGRPGPQTWGLGAYPEGQGDHPVEGVSWYEAAAYCSSAGKRLPTVYEWRRAAATDGASAQVRNGNLDSEGPERVGHTRRLGRYGTYDLAGNVKEWVWNQEREELRFLLGGGWRDPRYSFVGLGAHLPLERKPMFGFRCAKSRLEPSDAQMSRLLLQYYDYRGDSPAADREFEVYRRLYDYTKGPLDARSEGIVDESADWRLERVNFETAYARERMTVLLWVPTKASPPYQTVVWLPDIDAYRGKPKLGTGDSPRRWFSFLLRSGRAVVLATVKGSYERAVPRSEGEGAQNLIVEAVKDIRRTIDYLETRSEFDTSKLAYVGMSFGAANAPIMTSMDPRFTASIMIAGGLQGGNYPPHVNPFNFLPRVTIPTLMINGKYDLLFQYERSQKPLFEHMGTREPHKQRVEIEGNHFPADRQQMHTAALDWLDKYLGPVGSR